MREVKNMFNKEHMGDPMYVFREAKKVPWSYDRIEQYIRFISGEIATQNNIIKKFESEGKDTTHLVYTRDRALNALGLCEAPEPYWKKSDRA